MARTDPAAYSHLRTSRPAPKSLAKDDPRGVLAIRARAAMDRGSALLYLRSMTPHRTWSATLLAIGSLGCADSIEPDTEDAGAREDSGLADTGPSRDAADRDADPGDPDGGADPIPTRLVILQSPAGTSPEEYRARADASGELVLEGILAPLQPIAAHVTFVHGLDLAPPPATGIRQQAAVATLLTAMPATTDDPEDDLDPRFAAGGPSIDQVLADLIEPAPLLSFALAAAPLREEFLSWREARAPTPAASDPVLAVDLIFPDDGAPSSTAVVALREAAAAVEPVPSGVYPAAAAQVLLSTIEVAFVEDATRIATFSFCGGICLPRFAHLGSERGFHELSRSDAPADRAELLAIERWFASVVAELAARLASVPTADGLSLLDHTLIVWMSDLGDGLSASWRDLPVVLVGSAGGRVRTGRVVEADGRVQGDLLVTLARALGVELPPFGDPSLDLRPIDELLVDP
jgi:hypothetical protein